MHSKIQGSQMHEGIVLLNNSTGKSIFSSYEMPLTSVLSN